MSCPANIRSATVVGTYRQGAAAAAAGAATAHRGPGGGRRAVRAGGMVACDSQPARGDWAGGGVRALALVAMRVSGATNTTHLVLLYFGDAQLANKN